ncbi:major facilitator superfamily protein [Sarocladium implicatum]|nr:major facilitator superfamily protein [Sarocladium implicatum]
MARSSEAHVVVTEQTPLQEAQVPDEDAAIIIQSQDAATVKDSSKKGIWLLCPLFIGVFIANADTSLVLATYTTISSDFSSLGKSSWLLTAYMLSMCSIQPLYGKLSNIFGRKALLIFAYILFGIGNVICGMAPSMGTAIAGRFVAGAGGAGMSSVVSYLIADLMPIREVATYRSYVNIVTTIGRSCGGPLGGKLTEMIGWRWTFLCQAPPTVAAILLVAYFIPSTAPATSENSKRSLREQIQRIDFIGSFFLCTTIILLLLPVTMGGNQVPWTHPMIQSLFTSAGVACLLFVLIESRWAVEPVFPLMLLRRWDIVAPYGVLLLQNMAQTFMMYSIPLYFQVTANASPSVAGYYLIPAVVGNTVGGLWTAAYIKKHGLVKSPTNLAALVAGLCHALIVARWNGATGVFEACYAFLGGLGTGAAHASTFIAVTVATSEEELAIAGGGLYLCGGLGSVLGVAAADSTLRAVFKLDLVRRLGRSEFTENVIKRLLKDLRYLREVPESVQSAAVAAYVKGFKGDFSLALICCLISLILGLVMRNLRLPLQTIRE